MKHKIYVETSVFSYLTARPSKTIIGAAHQQITASWWETRQQYDLFVSAPVLRECQAGDKSAAAKRMAALEGVNWGQSRIDLAKSASSARLLCASSYLICSVLEIGNSHTQLNQDV